MSMQLLDAQAPARSPPTHPFQAQLLDAQDTVFSRSLNDTGSNALLKSLIACLPEHEHLEAIRAATTSFSPNDKDAGTIASLLAKYSNDAARLGFRDHLITLLEAGHINAVISAGDVDAELRDELLKIAASRLYTLTGELQRSPGKAFAVPTWKAIQMGEHDAEYQNSDLPIATESAAPLLRYATTVMSPLIGKASTVRLLHAGLVLLGSSDRALCAAAGKLISKLATFPILSEAELNAIWQCMEFMWFHEAEDSHSDVIYTMWLRVASIKRAALRAWFGPQYWELLRKGLRYGDGERRKQCLIILRMSVAVATEHEATRPAICSVSAGSQNIGMVFDQYERYCTVVETILLGRYLNQVLACEDDLYLLSTPNALVNAEWLYTLLAATLDPRIQESSRKFIGNWIMRAKFQPDASAAFVDFFKTAFLSWATQGSLYTATLKKQDSGLRCGHGRRLADYVSTLLQHNASNPVISSQLIDAVLSVLSGRKSGNFAYASVYLLESLAQAYQSEKRLKLSLPQLEALGAMSGSTALPEVARDYVFVRCTKLCAESISRNPVDPGKPAVADAVRKWNRLDAELRGERLGAQHDKFVPIATWEAEPSYGVTMEQRALEKCQTLRAELQEGSGLTHEQIPSVLEDIWSDLEYLAYPKRLLLELQGLLLHPRLVHLVLQAGNIGKLREMLPDLLRRLQELSLNRAYMLAPLMLGVRENVLAQPDFARLITLEQFIETYAMRLPEVTVDLQLEDTTTHLLQEIAPHFHQFTYEYYFGNRKSVGIAALLDLVSRLGVSNIGGVRALFHSLLQRWARQKGHVATVTPWKGSLQLQLMLLCCEQALPHLSTNHIQSTLKTLHHVLSIEPLPRYRYLLTWIIARIYLNRDDVRTLVLTELRSNDHHSNPKYLASLMRLGVMLARTEGADDEFATGLATAFVPLAASSKVVIRHEAQWQVPQLMDHARARGWAAITANAAFAALDDYVRNVQGFGELPPERYLDRFDPVKDHTMTNLVEGLWYGLDNTEVSLCGRKDFVKLYEAEAQAQLAWPPPCLPLGDPIVAPAGQQTGENVDTSAASAYIDTPLAPLKASESRALQTKGTVYLASGLGDLSEKQVRRDELIVVASLVDNPSNLGGLSRVAEIFGACELHLRNQNVTSNKDFTNVSVSSHLHLPIHQLSASGVPDYLAEKKREGWTIVGIEQTDRSLILGSPECKLPEKIVLVIGSEREGVPALVLSECDMLVEIPQQGITRSLNVQTAAAIVLFEYARQYKQPRLGATVP